MTENEAIGYFRIVTDEAGHEEFSDLYKEMCSMAIQALEEIQQYRAIGTVDELQVLNRIAEETAEYVKEDKKILEAYKRIGTIEEFKASKEKSVAKKPICKTMPYSEEVGMNDEYCYDCRCYEEDNCTFYPLKCPKIRQHFEKGSAK